MPRLHLFELEDQAWFPGIIRDAGTAYLQLSARFAGLASKLTPKLRETIERTGATHLVDLCSGGAGPIPTIVEELAAEGVDVRATLTDCYPNLGAFEALSAGSGGRLDFVRESVDATEVPDSLSGLRTLFNALHHFRPDAARRVLQSAVDAGQPIGAFEMVGRHPFQIVSMLFVFIPVMLAVPFLRPFRWGWLPLTYLVPVIPLFVMWDGLVSCLRVYSHDELRALVESLEDGDRFDWDIGTIEMPPVPAGVAYLVGTPRRAVVAATSASGERT